MKLKPFHQTFLIKPASSRCNLNCDYCFYHIIAESRDNDCRSIMKKDIVDQLLKIIFAHDSISGLTFFFQGGEPLLAGYDYFKYFLEKAQSLNKRRIKIAYSLQTNGTLFNDEILKLLKDNNFLVGISIDGPKDIHNKYRDNSFDRVMEGLDQLKAWGIPYNILSVVSDNSAPYAREIYDFFKSTGSCFIQFIPYLSVNEGQSVHQPSALQFGEFLIDLLDEWFNDIMSGKMISISNFEDIIKNMLQLGGATCGMNGNCSLNLVIESQGDVYPCDFYTKDEDCLFNLKNTSNLSDIFTIDSTKKFIKYNFIHPDCKICPYQKICKGGCKAYKDDNGLYCYCESYKALFEKRPLKLNSLASMFYSRM